MSHYTLGWHDTNNKHYEIGEYADDAFEAARFAREDVPYLQEHPHFVDYCISEEVKKISDFMASGIPMGR